MWAEWVDSDSNPADPFSRDLRDSYAVHNLFTRVQASAPDWKHLLHTSLLDLRDNLDTALAFSSSNRLERHRTAVDL
eukprot:9913013-Karenia_brevis.AAC.1